MSYNVLLPNSTLYFVRCRLFTWMSGSGSWVAKDFSVSSGVGSHDLAPGTRSTRWPSTLVKEPCFVFGGSCSLSMGITVVSISMSYNNKWLIKPVHYHTEFPMAVLLDLHQLTQLAPNKNHWMCTLFAVKNGTENPWNPNVVPISTPVVPFFSKVRMVGGFTNTIATLLVCIRSGLNDKLCWSNRFNRLTQRFCVCKRLGNDEKPLKDIYRIIPLLVFNSFHV